VKQFEEDTAGMRAAQEDFARGALALETGLVGLASRVKHIEEDAAGIRRAEEDLARAAQALETGLGGLASRVQHIEEDAAGKRRAEEDFARTFDELYATFEEQFRGLRDDVKGRVAVYVPYLVDAGLGTSEAPVLDLGCGRGEWLEVLKDHGLRARGADTNRTMLAYCRTLGLDVVESDALACLRETPAASLGAVTGFHIVEHLSLPYLVSLLKETARTLRPGGIAIFETPNPENVLVGSHTFYLDPTHVNPLPSATLRFFVEATGLRDVEIVFLHPSPDYERLTAGDQAVETFVNSRFFGPRDYAVIARKA
jgi:O-antigen chain-terminating methyltransferase